MLNLGGNSPYRILGTLGKGGMGQVYLVETRGVDGFRKQFAMKMILANSGISSKTIDLFTREAKITSLLQHSNIVQVYNYFQTNGAHYILMEYVPGKTLEQINRELRQSNDIFPFELLMYIGVEVCRGLGYAHTKKSDSGEPLKIVHRDISPQNVMLSYEGAVKVLDFGIAAGEVDKHNTLSGDVAGKIAYMSPEQLNSRLVDHRSDLYSFSLLLAETLIGDHELPIVVLWSKEKEAIKLIQERYPSLDLKAATQVYLTIRRGIEQDKEKRFQSAYDFEVAISKLSQLTGHFGSPTTLSSFMENYYEEPTKTNVPPALPNLTVVEASKIQSGISAATIVSQRSSAAVPPPLTRVISPRPLSPEKRPFPWVPVSAALALLFLIGSLFFIKLPTRKPIVRQVAETKANISSAPIPSPTSVAIVTPSPAPEVVVATPVPTAVPTIAPAPASKVSMPPKKNSLGKTAPTVPPATKKMANAKKQLLNIDYEKWLRELPADQREDAQYAQRMYSQGEILLDDGKLFPAFDRFRRARMLDPKNVAAWVSELRALGEMGEKKEARAVAELLVKKNKDVAVLPIVKNALDYSE